MNKYKLSFNKEQTVDTGSFFTPFKSNMFQIKTSLSHLALKFVSFFQNNVMIFRHADYIS